MYLSIPNVFDVPIKYVELHVLNIEELEILHERNSYNEYSNKPTKRDHITIGVILPNETEARWARGKAEMENLAKVNELNLKIEYSHFNLANEVKLVEKLLSEDVNVLIYAPLNHPDEEELFKKVKNAGVKVIAYYWHTQKSDVDLFVGFNSFNIGELKGRHLTRKVPKGNYIILTGMPNGELLKKGAMEYIGPLVINRDIKIVTDGVVKGWDPKIAFKIVEDSLIANNNKVDAILAPNDVIANTVIEVLKMRGLEGKVAVTGQDAEVDAIKRVIEGTQLMTVFKDSRKLAKIAIEAAIKLVDGIAINEINMLHVGKKNVQSIIIEPIALDKTNIHSVLKENGYYIEDLY